MSAGLDWEAAVKNRWLWAAGLILALAPAIAYYREVALVPGLAPQAARELTWRLDAPALLIDLRPAADFESNRQMGSENWLFSDIMRLGPGDPVLKQFADRPVVLLCESGVRSARAAAHLRSLSVEAYRVTGGMEAWMAAARKPCIAALARGSISDDEARPLFFRPSSRGQQRAVAASSFVLTPIYVIATGLLLFVLRSVTARDLRALRAGLWFFFLGEIICTANQFFLREPILALDYTHDVLMVVTFCLMAYAVFDGVDSRIVKRRAGADGACSATELCGGCAVHSGARCLFERMFLMLIPASASLAAVSLLAKPFMVSYNTSILGTVFSYYHSTTKQLFELRYLPWVAVAFSAAAFAVLFLRRSDRVDISKALFAVAAGALGFSLLRLVIYFAYPNDLGWFMFWEETSEFIFIAAVAWVLWVFRRGLLAKAA